MANGKSLKERRGYVRTLARSRRKEKRTARLLLFSAGMDARLMEYKTETWPSSGFASNRWGWKVGGREGNGARCEGREINSEWRFADAREKKDCEIANIIRDEKKILYASSGIMKFRKRDRKSFFLGRFVVIKFRSNVSSRDCCRSLRIYTKYPIKRSIFPLVNCCVRTSFFFLFFFQWS